MFADRPGFSHDLFLIDYSQLAVLELKLSIDKYSLHIRFSRGINQVGSWIMNWSERKRMANRCKMDP